jgi:hypothetical protein
MAVMKNGKMFGDPTPAFVCQVIEHVNKNPPVRPVEIGHCCFPGYMNECQYQDNEWKKRLEELIAKVDERMQVLHSGNFIWRRTLKNRDITINTKEPTYYRRNDRRKIIELPGELAWIPFFEIKPFKDERFPVTE